MRKEFEQNWPGKSVSPASESKTNSESEEYVVEKDAVESEDSDDVAPTDGQDVVPDVDNIFGITDMAEYDLSTSFSAKFYSEDAVVHWPLISHRGLIEEMIIDMEAYAKQNLIKFLKDMALLSTVTNVQPYCRPIVLDFYCNLLSSVGDVHSGKFGKVFVRDRLYAFSPSIINSF